MRITIDLDTLDIYALNAAFRRLTQVIKNEKSESWEIQITPSPGGHGYHLIASGLPISKEQSLKYREMIGDDPKRIEIDKSHPKRISQVMFNKKSVKKVNMDAFYQSQY